MGSITTYPYEETRNELVERRLIMQPYVNLGYNFRKRCPLRMSEKRARGVVEEQIHSYIVDVKTGKLTFSLIKEKLKELNSLLRR